MNQCILLNLAPMTADPGSPLSLEKLWGCYKHWFAHPDLSPKTFKMSRLPLCLPLSLEGLKGNWWVLSCLSLCLHCVHHAFIFWNKSFSFYFSWLYNISAWKSIFPFSLLNSAVSSHQLESIQWRLQEIFSKPIPCYGRRETKKIFYNIFFLS